MRSRLTTITTIISTAAIAAKEIILVFLVTIEPPGATGHALPHAFSPSELCRGNKNIAGRIKTSCRFEFEPELVPQSSHPGQHLRRCRLAAQPGSWFEPQQ